MLQDGLAGQDGQAFRTTGKGHGGHKGAVKASFRRQGFGLVGHLARHLAHLLQGHHVGPELAQGRGHQFHPTL